jgi:hypothetical protein
MRFLSGFVILSETFPGVGKRAKGAACIPCRKRSAEFLQIDRDLLLRRNTEVISEQREEFRGLGQIFLMI